MHMKQGVRPMLVVLGLLASAGAVLAQVPVSDASARLREVLPADVAERVIARIAEARGRELPAQALENRALKFAARGVAPADLERAVTDHAARLDGSRSALVAGRGSARPAPDEVEAGAEALRMGVDGEAVRALARSAPSGRSLTVPLYVLGSLVERGLPSDQALARVRERLMQRASDTDLERLPAGVGRARGPDVGPGSAGPGRPAGAGPPAPLPGNGGARANPGGTPPPGGGRRP